MCMKLKLFAMVALLAATTFMFTSCSKESQITGKWRVTRANSSEINVSNDKDETWTFKEKGKFSGYMGNLDVSGTWKVSGDELTIESDDKLYIEGAYFNAIAEFTIDELKNKEMSLSGNLILKNAEYGTLKYKVKYELEKK